MSDDDERRAFREATAGVRPLKPDNRAAPEHRKPLPRARRRREEDASVLRDSLRAHWLEGLHGEVWFSQPTVPQRTVARLRRGEYAVEAELDLHGLNRSNARLQLRDFLIECARRQIGCVRIIHGMGHRSGPSGPVLKDAVQSWLTQWDDILAFASAGPRRGGNGAVVALLRRR